MYIRTLHGAVQGSKSKIIIIILFDYILLSNFGKSNNDNVTIANNFIEKANN